MQGDFINVNSQLNDLNDIKTRNTRDGVLLLRKMDNILGKFSKQAPKAKELSEITQK